MTNPDYAYVSLIVDRSGSMAAIQSEAEAVVNDFMNERKDDATPWLDLEVVEFDSVVRIAIPQTKAKKLRRRYKLEPGNMTALYDAVGATVDRLGTYFESLDENVRPDRVVVAIVTDGHENFSQDYDAAAVKARIETQRDVYGWDFVFMGANQDAILSASEIGIRRNSSMTYDVGSTRVAGQTMSAYVGQSVAGASPSFTDEDRDEAMGK